MTRPSETTNPTVTSPSPSQVAPAGTNPRNTIESSMVSVGTAYVTYETRAEPTRSIAALYIV